MTPKHKLAIEIFTRDNFMCCYCGRIFSEDQPPLHLHRRVFGSQGGKYDKKNLASCCWECHADHGSLKNRRLITENDNTKMDSLLEYYSI